MEQHHRRVPIPAKIAAGVLALAACLAAGGCDHPHQGGPRLLLPDEVGTRVVVGGGPDETGRGSKRDESRLETSPSRPARAGPNARQWLVAAHARLRRMLPADEPEALLTDGLTDADGRPIDVYDHFALNRSRLQSLAGNWRGLTQTLQCASGPPTARDPESCPPWPGFEQVWIPVDGEATAPDDASAPDGPVRLSGWLGLVRKDGRVAQADCIIVLPGLFGDSGNWRDRDMSHVLLERGFHVLALEHRGHGLTDHRHPDVPYLFGVVETGDLLAVDEWLRRRPHVRRVGLIGYSWGANHVLLAAWYGAVADSAGWISERLRRRLRPPGAGGHFGAGVIACSPVLDFERFLERVDSPRSVLVEPALAAIQNIVRQRMVLKGYDQPGGDLRRLVGLETERWRGAYAGVVADCHEFLRLVGAAPGRRKLSVGRVPALIIQGANDPMGTAQEVADAVAGLGNPNVAAVVLPGGGHVGFAHYARGYYLDLVAGFFDPQSGPVAVEPRTDPTPLSTAPR